MAPCAASAGGAVAGLFDDVGFVEFVAEGVVGGGAVEAFAADLFLAAEVGCYPGGLFWFGGGRCDLVTLLGSLCWGRWRRFLIFCVSFVRGGFGRAGSFFAEDVGHFLDVDGGDLLLAFLLESRA